MKALGPIRIEGIAHGGDGVGLLPSGKKVFVPLVAAGDLVEIEVVEEREQLARGRLLRLVEPGPERVTPPCRHASICGGCQLQQLSEEGQLEAKERAFYDALHRLGGVPRASIPDARSIVPSPRAFRYRSRCRLNVREGQVGYLERGSHRLVTIEACWLLEPALEALVLALAARLRERPIPHLAAIECCVGDDGGGAVALEPLPNAPANWSRKAGELLGIVQGVVALAPVKAASGRRPAPQRPTPVIFGDPVVRRSAPFANGVTLLARPDAFSQANAAANVALVEAAIEGLDLEGGEEILELYSGAGNFSFALAAQGARVTAVEGAGVSSELARQVSRTQDAGAIRYVVGDAVQVARSFAQEGRRFDRILLDPPRAGAKGLPQALAALGPKRIAYVSCDPATLARDVAALGVHGYEPVRATPVDMFPQTFHVEGVVILEDAKQRSSRRPPDVPSSP